MGRGGGAASLQVCSAALERVPQPRARSHSPLRPPQVVITATNRPGVLHAITTTFKARPQALHGCDTTTGGTARLRGCVAPLRRCVAWLAGRTSAASPAPPRRSARRADACPPLRPSPRLHRT